LEWANDFNCNLGKPNFDSIEFHTTSSRIEIVCGKCHGVICWWPISIEQGVPMAARGTKKSSAIRTIDRNIQVT
jgi:hypothetical protein